MNAFAGVSRSGEEPGIWAAWGHDCGKARLSQNLPCGHDGHRRCIPCKVVSGRQALKKGHPHHPLYLRKDLKLEDFDMAAYLKAL